MGATLLASLVCGAHAADLPTQPPTPASAPSCFASFVDYLLASAEECPLTWNGITLYGTLDYGAGYQTNGAPFNNVYPNGVEELISKNSNGRRYVLIPNGLGQSYIGVKGNEPIASDWSLVFNLQNGFNPYTLERANGPKSLVQNNTTPLDAQTANGDSSRAGQLFNTVAYAGLSHPTYGTLTAGRQRFAHSGWPGRLRPHGGRACFLGDRNFQYGSGRRRHGGRALRTPRSNIGSTSARSGWPRSINSAATTRATARTARLTRKSEAISADSRSTPSAARSRMRCRCRISANCRLPSGVAMNDLKATLSDNTSGVIMLRYTYGAVKLYGGFEYILFRNPTDAYPEGFTTIGNYNVLPGYVTSTAYDNNKILRVFWTGAKYAVRDDIDVAGAFYHYYQNDYNTSACTDGGLSASSCAGTLNALSAMIDYRPAKRLDLYAGVMWSQVTGGLASGYLYHQNFGPTAGLRLQF